MIEALPPGLVLILGALVIPLLPRRTASVWTVVLGIVSFIQVLLLEPGVSHQLEIFGHVHGRL